MAIADNKARITITLGRGVLERLDAYCERSGMSRSAYISYCVAYQLDAQNQITDGVVSATRDVLTSALEGMQDKEKMNGVLGAL